MSTSIKVGWDCTCRIKSGYVDGDTDTIYCNTCDGVITTLDKLKMTDIKRYDTIQKVIDADMYGDKTDLSDYDTPELELGEY